jgi:hypothetical protein
MSCLPMRSRLVCQVAGADYPGRVLGSGCYQVSVIFVWVKRGALQLLCKLHSCYAFVPLVNARILRFGSRFALLPMRPGNRVEGGLGDMQLRMGTGLCLGRRSRLGRFLIMRRASLGEG